MNHPVFIVTYGNESRYICLDVLKGITLYLSRRA